MLADRLAYAISLSQSRFYGSDSSYHLHILRSAHRVVAVGQTVLSRKEVELLTNERFENALLLLIFSGSRLVKFIDRFVTICSCGRVAELHGLFPFPVILYRRGNACTFNYFIVMLNRPSSNNMGSVDAPYQ